ncbi:MAG: hypothetical protein KAW49_03240, partial [Anaerolineae bacterium]|nr:hypothetical protein [Anaerolineae bacterium]
TVVTYTYETMDEALATLAMTETKKILDDHFTAHTPVTPTLLFAREERYRGANLDQALDDDDGVVQWSDDNPRQLTLVLSEEDAPLETVTGINWAPYHYRDDEWQAYPIEEYWDELHQRYTAAFASEYDDDDDPEAARGGAVIVGQTHYLAIYVGVSAAVQSGDELLTQTKYQTYDKPLWSKIVKAGAIAVRFVVNTIIMWHFYQSTQAMKALYRFMQQQRFAGKNVSTMDTLIKYGRAIKNQVSKWMSTARGIKIMGVVMIGVIVLLAAVIVGMYFLIKAYMADNMGVKIALAVIVGALFFYFSILTPILQVVNLVMAFRAAQNITTFAAAGKVLSSSSKFIGISRAVAIAGLVIAVGIVWGIFIYAIVTNDIPANSVAFDMLLAQTIAATILAILQFALSLTIVGAILVAIVALVDIVFIILGSDWTISGWVTDVITKTIFSYELAIDVDAKDLVAMGGFESAIVYPERGMVAGNQMEFSIPITTTVVHQDPKDWRTKFYMWMYDKDQIRSTTFKYDLSPGGASLSADLGDIKGDWRIFGRGRGPWNHFMWGGYKHDDLSTVTTLQAGVNRQVDLTLTTAYAIPGVECWTLIIIIPWPPIYLPIPVCFEKGVDGSESGDVGPILLDVLPATLDEFVDVATWADGMVFRDRDGDGLLAQTYNGNDPDDTTWDTDGDGLSDKFEYETPRVHVCRKDSDSDGLEDGLELGRGSLP